MKVLTVISNYNEEKSIRDTINNFINSNFKSDLLVIDNCSIDNSFKIIKNSNVNYIFHPVNTGGSFGVIKTAFLYAYLYNYDIYCHMDGDNQHDANQLNELIKPIVEKKADIVIGSRFIIKEGFQSLFFRRIGIKFFSKIISIIIRYPITDITSGFRAYSRNAIDFFGWKYKHIIEPTVQMILLAHFIKFKIIEVPVNMKERKFGKSEIDLIKALKFPIYSTIYIVGTILQGFSIRR